MEGHSHKVPCLKEGRRGAVRPEQSKPVLTTCVSGEETSLAAVAENPEETYSSSKVSTENAMAIGKHQTLSTAEYIESEHKLAIMYCLHLHSSWHASQRSHQIVSQPSAIQLQCMTACEGTAGINVPGCHSAR